MLKRILSISIVLVLMMIVVALVPFPIINAKSSDAGKVTYDDTLDKGFVNNDGFFYDTEQSESLCFPIIEQKNNGGIYNNIPQTSRFKCYESLEQMQNDPDYKIINQETNNCDNSRIVPCRPYTINSCYPEIPQNSGDGKKIQIYQTEKQCDRQRLSLC